MVETTVTRLIAMSRHYVTASPSAVAIATADTLRIELADRRVAE
jgi:hypothetical protein